MKILSYISKKFKGELVSKEFRVGLKIEIVSLLAIFVLIGIHSQFSSNLLLEIIYSIVGVFIIFFLPGYMTYRKLKQDNIKNKINIIFFCYPFMASMMILAVWMTQLYQGIIPSFIITTPLTIFPEIDFSLLGLYAGILPFKIIVAKFSFRFVVLLAILGSSSGTTTDDDKYPY